jgi:drug/metabolite transporter (DMT)-like permease
MLWGYLFLGEALSWNMVIGCAVIVVGTALVVQSQRK